MLSLRSTRHIGGTSARTPVTVVPGRAGVELHGAGAPRPLDVEPDAVLADRFTSCARRCEQVDLFLGAGQRHAVLTAVWHRLPQRRTIPLTAGLALALRGVPTVLVGERVP